MISFIFNYKKMKKITLISLLLAGIFIFGCSQNGDNNQIDTEVDTQITNSGFSSLSDKVQKYKFSWKMEKPSSKEIKNLNYFWD
jgi:outer membrane murein-binding lipoprotein Lpp